MVDTKNRILDTAERLFAEQGYDATSLRQVIAAAGVNLAAVHYHFGSKEDLLMELVLRKLEPVNQERMRLLQQAERESAGKPRVEAILGAFLLPTATAAGRNPDFVKLMGRLVAEGIIDRLAQQHFQPLLDRFVGAFQRALPDLDREELGWRIYFMFGAMARALCGSPQPWLTGESADLQEKIDKLIVFLTGGFLAAAGRPARAAAGRIEVKP